MQKRIQLCVVDNVMKKWFDVKSEGEKNPNTEERCRPLEEAGVGRAWTELSELD